MVVAYRQANYGTPLRTEPARTAARYHIGAELSPTQYLCLHPLGPLAEFMRRHTLRTEEQLRQVRLRTWALRLEADRLQEIGFDNAESFAIDAAALVDDDVTECQRLAAALRPTGRPGIVVPSAALPGTQNVVLFGPRVGSPYLHEPIGEVDVPASITAADGRPLASLLDRVRFRGDRHPALEAWERGARYAFEEPDWGFPA